MKKFLKHVKLKLQLLPFIQRHCILCADEMSLKSYLFYDISRDEIIGFEDIGIYNSAISAQNAFFNGTQYCR